MTALLDVAAELDKSPAQVAIAWILSHDEITCAISGADNIDQIDDVIGSVGWQIPDELLDRLDQVSSRIPLRPPERIPGAWGWARS